MATVKQEELLKKKEALREQSVSSLCYSFTVSNLPVFGFQILTAEGIVPDGALGSKYPPKATDGFTP